MYSPSAWAIETCIRDVPESCSSAQSAAFRRHAGRARSLRLPAAIPAHRTDRRCAMSRSPRRSRAARSTARQRAGGWMVRADRRTPDAHRFRDESGIHPWSKSFAATTFRASTRQPIVCDITSAVLGPGRGNGSRWSGMAFRTSRDSSGRSLQIMPGYGSRSSRARARRPLEGRPRQTGCRNLGGA